jgi:drug/metabolite transporter (DMT)-like permease
VSDARLLIAALVLVDSVYYIFARLLFPLLPPGASAMYMMVLGAAQIAGVMRARIDLGILRRHLWFFLAIGALVGANTYMGFAAVQYVDPGTASLLSRTSVLFGVALGLLWLGERLTRVEVIGAALAVAGVVAVSLQPGDHFQRGSLLVIASTALYAVHSAIVKRYGGGIPFGQFMFFRVAAVAAVLVALVLAGGDFVWPTPVVWGWLLVTAFVNVVVSRGLYYLALRRLDMSVLAIVLTLTPVVTWLWSIALFGSRPSGQEIAGGVATLAGVLVVTSSRARGASRRARGVAPPS